MAKGTDQEEKAVVPKLKLTNLVFVLLVAAVVAAVVASVFFYKDAQNAKSQTPDAVAARNKEDSARIIGLLDSVLLTESESEPTVARVENPEALITANPDFYKSVQTGDYLILYPQRAIIFRSEEQRVINVAPIIDTSRLNTSGATEQVAEDGGRQ